MPRSAVRSATPGAPAVPNTLIFFDFPSDDASAAAKFYGEVFNWTVEPRPEGVFHRIVPGGFFPNPDGSDSLVGNLHLGIFDSKTAYPDPNTPPFGGGDRPSGTTGRIYILVADDDTEDAILARAEERGAEILWRGWYWKEFNGWHASFKDPWGTQVILWSKAGDDPQIPEGRLVDGTKG